MDADELTRAIVGVPVAVVAPRFVPGFGGRRARIPAVAALSAWSLGPVLDRWESWLLIACAVAVSQGMDAGGAQHRALLARAAGGVALVVAAKSLARLPSLSREDKFAEYFLIGTLASVVVAVGIAMAVRAVLGLGPLLS